ncbi:RNA polymerase sigma factor [Elizabethkingia sp. JS20170427COW]|uniref:RNA polymerase sigma factor n=1 Tax=Elizabethkingia sp. JS20170427COW TaxID=2583851 RepID=UPI00110FF9BE|nr:sigma-70 family RNA polymerase sigma factor [Elizabethkingia sp. JS20170427COW]QCX53178.1 sigma-70 family RNA polymerase sigma factor [Elizabethkingia sp. JS20170427COW]
MEIEQVDTLIVRCQNNDKEAQAALYQKYSGILFSICLRYSNSYEDAQDVFQEGFLHAFAKIKQYQFKGSFEGWLKRLMVNFCLDKYRKESKYRIEPLDDISSLSEIEEEEVPLSSHQNLDYNTLLRAVQNLPPRYRQVFNLYIFEEFSHQEIAESLNISIGTSKSNLSRARDFLKNYLLHLNPNSDE